MQIRYLYYIWVGAGEAYWFLGPHERCTVVEKPLQQFVRGLPLNVGYYSWTEVPSLLCNVYL